MTSTPDDPRCDPLRRDLSRRLLMCNADELEVLDALFGRLEKGRDSYGHLDLDRARDWERELAEELLDVQVYRAIAAVRSKHEKPQSVILICNWCGARATGTSTRVLHHPDCPVGKVTGW